MRIVPVYAVTSLGYIGILTRRLLPRAFSTGSSSAAVADEKNGCDGAIPGAQRLENLQKMRRPASDLKSGEIDVRLGSYRLERFQTLENCLSNYCTNKIDEKSLVPHENHCKILCGLALDSPLILRIG